MELQDNIWCFPDSNPSNTDTATCPTASAHQQREDACCIPTTPGQINNLPLLNTSESPCLQMFCTASSSSSLLLLNHTADWRRATLPAYDQHTQAGRQPWWMAFALCRMHKGVIHHLPAQRKETLSSLAASCVELWEPVRLEGAGGFGSFT